jgi:Cupin-like domain
MASCASQPVKVVASSFQIDCLDHAPSPPEFYDRYVAPRKPVLLRKQCSTILDQPHVRSNLSIPQLQRIARTVEDASAAASRSNGRHQNYMVEVNKRQEIVPSTTDDNERVLVGKDSSENGHSTQPKFSYSPTHGSQVCTMPLSTFLNHLLSSSNDDNDTYPSNDDYYMTTQTLRLDEEGRPAVTTWLSDHLIYKEKVLPLRPLILGHLIPMNAANLWLGRSAPTRPGQSRGRRSSANRDHDSESDATTFLHHRNGATTAAAASSGLHHDFHDNLYCLIHGFKLLRLAPPHAVDGLRMAGTVHTVHKNGRIVYHEQSSATAGAAAAILPSSTGSNQRQQQQSLEMLLPGDCPIRPDGALVSVERLVQLELRKEGVEQQLEALDRGETCGESQRALLEAELDEIEEELLDFEIEDNPHENGEGEDFGDEDYDDDDDEDSEAGVFFGDQSEVKMPPNKRVKLFRSSIATTDTEPAADIVSVKRQSVQNVRNDEGSITKNANDEQLPVPPNFVVEENACIPFEWVEMRAGDVMYLPAGWFHEVFSMGSDTGTDNDGATTTNNGIHMAINYWVHPPDVGPGTSFTKPYLSTFWQRDWDTRGLD